MGKKEYKQRTKTKDAEEVEAVEPVEQEEEFNVDCILDEIDEVLEENAEVFVRDYIQRVDNRGGKRVVTLV